MNQCPVPSNGPRSPESFRHTEVYATVKEWEKECRGRIVARGKWNVKKKKRKG